MNSIPEGDKFDSGKIFKTTSDKFQSSISVDPNVFRASEFVFHGIIPFNVIVIVSPTFPVKVNVDVGARWHSAQQSNDTPSFIL